MQEWDITRHPEQDVLNSDVAETIFEDVRNLLPHCVICTPPWNTFSRTRHNFDKNPGPRPIRDSVYPLGFPWLSERNKRLADEANALVEFTWILFELCRALGLRFFTGHPEDLGATPTGRPASIWQSTEFSTCLQSSEVWTFAIHQCAFGAESATPTRFVTNLHSFPGQIFAGTPVFDKLGHYIGPLPRRCSHNHKPRTGQLPSNAGATSPAATYPDGLCKAIADSIFDAFQITSASGGSNFGHLHSDESLRLNSQCMDTDVDDIVDESLRLNSQCMNTDVDDLVGAAQQRALVELEQVEQSPHVRVAGDDANLHWSQLQSGCSGPPMTASLHGRAEHFVDGFGKCSPGCWSPKVRGVELGTQAQEFASKLRTLLDNFCRKELKDLARTTFMLATGKLSSSPFSEESMKKLRSDWFQLLPDPIQAGVKTKFQPFFLHALSQTSRMLEDPDWEILCSSPGGNYADGVPVGHTEPIQNVCQVFDCRVKDPTYDQSDLQLIMDNYRTPGTSLKEILEEQFAEEERAGRMFPLSLAEARARYPGDRLRIAAQGALEKPGGGYRVIHDATHGVNLNNQIVSDNKLVNPGPRELATILTHSGQSHERVLFGIAADIAKAHRLFIYKPDHWGVLGCRTHENAEVIWFNRTGTFGVASAAVWWSRLAGIIGRLAYKISFRDWLFILIFVDDMLVTAGGKDRWLTIWRVIACFEMCGAPFGYHKFKGGLQLDYVGFWLDYAKFNIGIAERRSNWIIKFIDQLEASHWLTDTRRFHEFHGRLGFMSQILNWIKPFLSAGYAWLAVVKKGAVLTAPPMVQFCCKLVRQKLCLGFRTFSCELEESDVGEFFRTDAKCERGQIVLGGWFTGKSLNTMEAPWFSLKITPQECPYLFHEDGESSWASTSAELLAALVALMVFDIRSYLALGQHFQRLVVHGGVDNRATSFLAKKSISTKTPLLGVLMEYLHQADQYKIRCVLDWRPREVNKEADSLTNSDFRGFADSNRIQISWNDLNLTILSGCADMLLKFTDSLKRVETPETRPAKFQKTVWE